MISVAVRHRTRYEYDRAVAMSPHEIRLRPDGVRTPIAEYRLAVHPAGHRVRWQRDAYGNHVAKLFFFEHARELVIDVEFVAALWPVNPFDFIVDPHAEQYPFEYGDADRSALAPYLEAATAGPDFLSWADGTRRRFAHPEMRTADLVVVVNRAVADEIRYVKRTEPGVQSCDETLRLASGSCRDSTWLLVQALRRCGIAARFVSGYLVQLATPGAPHADSVELHAWCEAYLPGAGWIGLDPTSGLLTGEGHLFLAAADAPGETAPVQGSADAAESILTYEMHVARLAPDGQSAQILRPAGAGGNDRVHDGGQ